MAEMLQVVTPLFSLASDVGSWSVAAGASSVTVQLPASRQPPAAQQREDGSLPPITGAGFSQVPNQRRQVFPPSPASQNPLHFYHPASSIRLSDPKHLKARRLCVMLAYAMLACVMVVCVLFAAAS
ncbi:hypothetical protein BKA56DRAFT_625831 [Ilyonectria sp. MPI-CAGE-AT-0026]|nr:hypothetical protein BKA56DRAFT_625831 [Ilyonectria sp. MPI-CAGE-AT-0026]